MTRFVYRFILLLLTLVIFAGGCNLFEFANPMDSSVDYLQRGQERYWNGDYPGAVEDFHRALELDPNSCEARWWHAKALLRLTGRTPIELLTSVSDLNTVGDTLPFMDWEQDEVDGLYRSVTMAESNLHDIYFEELDCIEIDRESVALDYCAVLAIQAILTIRDTNVDMRIDNSDIDVASYSYFENDTFIVPRDLWDQLSSGEKNALINRVEDRLDVFEVVYDDIAPDLEELVPGFDVENISDALEMIRVELENLRP